MDFAGINYLAVLVAAIVAFAFGAIWYGVLSKPWMKAAGIDKETVEATSKSDMTFLMISTFVAQLIMAWVLAGLIGHLGQDQVTLYNGVISAGFIWFGFVATTLFVNHGFQMQSRMLTLVAGGHWLAVLLIQGAISGAFGA